MSTTKIVLAFAALALSSGASFAAERTIPVVRNHETLQTVRMERDIDRSTITGLPASQPTIFGHAVLEATYGLAGQGGGSANR